MTFEELKAFIYYVSQRKGDFGLLTERQAYRFIEEALERFFREMGYQDFKAIKSALSAPPYTTEAPDAFA